MSGNVLGAAAPTQTTFDLSQHEQVLALLNYVRRGTLDPELQNEVRNTILDYTATQNDALLKKVMTLVPEVTLVTDGSTAPKTNAGGDVKPVAATTTTAKVKTIGHARPKPRFMPVSVTEKPDTTPTTPEPQEPTQSNVPATPAPAAAVSTAAPTSPPEPVASVAASVPVPVVPESVVSEPIAPEAPAVVTAPEVESVVPTASVPVTSAISTEPPLATTPAPEAAAPVATPEPTPVAVSSVSDVEQLNRIKEIKRLVNQKVGNPVNLIDANNEVGREYMNALLDAMKKVHGGMPGDSVAAMQRLEVAYAAVEKTIAESGVVAPPKTKEPEPQPATPEPVIPAANIPEINKTVTPQPVPPTPAAPVIEDQSKAEAEVVPETAAPEPAGLRSLAADLAAVSTPVIEGATPRPVAPPASAAPVPSAVPLPNNTPAPQTDMLQTPEVTAGLAQLLSEWSLFKSSGIFGTGPSGIDHPLYKTLAPLSMAAVISGRFEGATPEVKQSITDCMNGWRYEQGVIHEMDEIFEHYLRRVIKSFLDKRPKKT